MEPSEAKRLWAEIATLRARIDQLERAAAHTEPSPEGGSHPSENGNRGSGVVVEPAPFVRPTRPTLESRIGSQWFNRIGIVALLVGAAWFLKYAVDQRWLGPAARVLIGLGAGVALITWSERFRRRAYPIFSFSLKALGAGLLYLSIWAAYDLFQLLSYPVAFVAMAVVTLGYAAMCWVQRSEVLAAFAAMGGFLTPALLAAPSRTPAAVLGSYLLLLNGGLFALLVLRRWPRLLAAAFAGTVGYLLAMAWGAARHAESHGIALTINTVFFLLFALLSPVAARLGGRAATMIASGVAIANALVACFSLWLLPQRDADWIPGAMAAVYAVLLVGGSRVATRGDARVTTANAELPVERVAPRWESSSGRSFDVPAGDGASGPVRAAPSVAPVAAGHAALMAGLAALWLQSGLHGAASILGLGVEAALLLPLTLREDLFGADAVLRSPIPVGGLLTAASALLVFRSLFIHAWRYLQPPVLNARAGLFLLLAALCTLSVRVAAKHHALAHRRGEAPGQWSAMAGGAAVLGTALLLLGGVLEIRASAGAPFYVSCWGALLGAGILALGFRLRWAFLRWLALILLTLAVGKVFLFDTRALSQGYRILSFLGLGVLLLGVSFVYQRDLLHLRGEEHEG